MDLSSAEKSIQKVLEYVQGLATSDSKLYTKSKDKLKHITDLCIKITSVSSTILQTELLELDNCEFNQPNIPTELLDSVNSILAQAASLKTFFPNTQTDGNFKKLSNTKSEVLKIPNDKVRELVFVYRDTFSNLAKLDLDNTCIKNCIEIIHKWIEKRLFTKYPVSGEFHYNIYRIKNIIYSIILSYSNAIINDSIDDYINTFEDWFQSLEVEPRSNTWIAPYPVYQIEREISSGLVSSENVSLVAVLIFDVLWDLGLSKTMNKDIDTYDVFLNNYTLWNIVSKSNPDLLDNYEHYTNVGSTILQTNNIV